jgi:serpin B
MRDGTPSTPSPARPTEGRLYRPPAHGICRLRGRRFGGGFAAGSTALLATLLAACGGAVSSPTPPVQAGLQVTQRIGGAVELSSRAPHTVVERGTRDERSVASGEEAFSLGLLRELIGSSGSATNQVASPSSLATALAMLDLGARGVTGRQVASVLGTAQLSTTQLARGWDSLDTDLSDAAKRDGVALQQANSLWTQQGLRLVPAFMNTLSESFGAGLWQVNFAQDAPGATREINTWASQETHGRIPHLFAPGVLNASTALVLANAVYFKGAWAQPFSKATVPGTFHLGTGRPCTHRLWLSRLAGSRSHGRPAPATTRSSFHTKEAVSRRS